MPRSLRAGSCEEDWEVTANEVDVNSWKQYVGVFEGTNGVENKILLVRIRWGKGKWLLDLAVNYT